MSEPLATQMLLVMGSRRSRKVNFDRFRNFGQKKSQIRHLYIQGPKWPKNTEIYKSAKNGQIVTKVSFFCCLKNWELKYFWLGGVGDQKSKFYTDFEILAKKKLK